MGTELIHVCVQCEEERDWLLKTATEYLGGELVVVHLVSSNVTPDVALQGLDLNQIREGAEFTLLVDCDEFVGSMKVMECLRSVLDLYPEHHQWHLPWLMRTVLTHADFARGGYWGHVGKPIVRSGYMQSVINDHCFSVCVSGQHADGRSTLPLGVHGLVVVHLWSRSFADSLIKVFCNRFEDAKSADRDQALHLLLSGRLPTRLRILAYLDLQEGYLPLPNGLRHLISQFSEQEENQILKGFLTSGQREIAFKVFVGYRNHLRKHLHAYPCYPAVELMQLANLLPDRIC